jgi:hypothetical protein
MDTETPHDLVQDPAPWLDRLAAATTLAELLQIERDARGLAFGPFAGPLLSRKFGERYNALRGA